jgi:hypothetical protein
MICRFHRICAAIPDCCVGNTGLFAGKPRSYSLVSFAYVATDSKPVGARLAREGVGSSNTNPETALYSLARQKLEGFLQ